MNSQDVTLDDLSLYQRLDPSCMRDRILELPAGIRAAWRSALARKLPAEYGAIEKVLVLGMGGSAIAGDVLQSIHQAEGGVDVLVHRRYGLPPAMDERTLVVASSYSGNTAETLAAFLQAVEVCPRKLVITTGGKLLNLAKEQGIPAFEIGYVAPPRAAIAYSLFPLLGICQKLGLSPDRSADVEEAACVLESMQGALATTSPTSRNPAKQLALELYNRVVVVCASDIMSPVARRWKTQINENAKAWAFTEELPECLHNGIVGYPNPGRCAERMHVVFLRSHHCEPRNLAGYEVMCRLLEEAGVGYHLADAEGEERLAQIMSLILMGDWASYYLAMLYRVDPTPVDAIDRLKSALGPH